MDWESIRFLDGKERNRVRAAVNRIKVDSEEALKVAVIECEGVVYRMAYTKEEADSINLVYYHWTDDFTSDMFPCYIQYECGYIGITFDMFKCGSGYQVVTCLGYRTIRDKRDGRQCKPPYLDPNKMPANVNAYSEVDKRTMADILANLIASGCTLDQVTQYFANNKFIGRRYRIKQWMKRKDIRLMATKQVKSVLDSLGYSDQRVVELLGEAIDLAKKTKNAKALMEAVREVAIWRGFNDKDTETVERTAEITDYHKDMQKLEESKRTVKLIEKTEQ